ncbi:MAG: alpha-mannosidase, partial [Chloroflexota bacterium]
MIHKTRWTSQKIAQRLALIEPLVHRQRQVLPPFRLKILEADDAKPDVELGHDDRGWEQVEPNSYWINFRTNFVLQTTFCVPETWPIDAEVALHLRLGEPGDFSHPEALAYIDGVAHAACDRHHQAFLLPPSVRDGQEHALALHGWSGLDGWFKGETDAKLFMRECAVVQIDQPTRDFVALARVALAVADHLEEHHPAKGQLYSALNSGFVQLDLRSPMGDPFYDSVGTALKTLREMIEEAGPSLDADVYAAGHAHIDVAWLWTLAQTRNKTERTFHTVLRLMEQFPHYHFTQSQPQLYDYIRQDNPEIFAQIKARIEEGRWEPTGGMWVEADCNLSGSEGLARQFLLGRSFFKAHFGDQADTPILWLPDVFGYAWNLPQLIKAAGLEYFFTIKISWNQYNRLPYDSFWWQGLDGTRILTHFSPTQQEWAYERDDPSPSTYNADATPYQVLTSWRNFQQKDAGQPGAVPPNLMAYGYGDGGGGPTQEMLENLALMADFPGLPRVVQGRAIDFFRDLEETAGGNLPTWNGELYFEYHRGTYTTQARNKRHNRKGEFLLHDAEFLAVLAGQSGAYAYPKAQINRAWELICLNQFHDIIPGSSINEVYTDSERDYAEVFEIGNEIKREALTALAHRLPAETEIAVVNPNGFGG